MRKKIVPQGRHFLLALIGDPVSELCLGTFHTIVFTDLAGDQSQVRIFDSIVLSRGSMEIPVSYRATGSALSPLLEILDATVENALALHDGDLELTFSNHWILKVISTTGYEAWQFECPRLLRPVGGASPGCSAVGLGGGLAIS